MNDKIIIKYYCKSIYGQDREYIHPDCEGDRKIISQLVRMSTITPVIRELIHDLSRGIIQFEKTIAP